MKRLWILSSVNYVWILNSVPVNKWHQGPCSDEGRFPDTRSSCFRQGHLYQVPCPEIRSQSGSRHYSIPCVHLSHASSFQWCSRFSICTATADGEHPFDTHTDSKSWKTWSFQREMRNSTLPDIWLCLSSCDRQTLGAKARSMQVRKTCPCLEPTGTLSPDNSRLTKLSVLQTEYVLMGATQGRPEQGLAQNTIDLRVLLEQQTPMFNITSTFCPRQHFKNLRSIHVASASWRA